MSVQDVTVEAASPPDELPGATPRAGSPQRRWLPPLLQGALLAAVFAVHFRPWQPGLLEEWGLAANWRQQGWTAYTSSLPMFAGRPLHLLPHYLGLAIWDSSFAGEYALLGLVAVGQVWVAAWALAPVVRNRGIRWTVAAALGLHPWWLAGDVLRFLPAQVSVLAFVVWFGAVIRFVGSGRRRHIVLGSAVLLGGLLTYQLLVLSAVLAAATVAVTLGRGRRRFLEVVGSAAAVAALDTWYTLWLAPRFWPQSYENGIRSGGLHPFTALHSLEHTVRQTPSLAGFMAVTAVVVLASFLGRRISGRAAAVLLASLLLAPVTALALAGSPAQLNDPDRVGLPVGASAWVVLALVAALHVGAGRARWLVRAPAVLLAAFSVAATAVGYHHWSGDAGRQRALLDSVERVRATLPADIPLLVADNTGSYGDEYTLLPPYLDYALAVEQPARADVTLCTPAGVARNQPDAARFPIPTTPDCASVPGFASAVRIASASVPGGTVDIYRMAPR